MSIENTSEDTLNNEVLVDETNDSIERVATLEKELAEARELADKKADEARKANFKVEIENKYSKGIDEIKSSFEEKFKTFEQKISDIETENLELKKILSVKSSEGSIISTQPTEDGKVVPGQLNEQKLNEIRRQMGLIK